MGLHSSPSLLFDRIEAGGSLDRLPKHLVGTRAGLFHLLRQQQSNNSALASTGRRPPTMSVLVQPSVSSREGLALFPEVVPKHHEIPDIMLEDEFKFRSDLMSITARA